MHNKINKMNDIPHIYDMNEIELDIFMKQHLPTKKLEKDKYGEVFTNPILINKMLDLFPKSIWTNNKRTWLDPSVGSGFFMICVYMRLMNGLKKWEPNEKKRSKHIIKNMLYMVELNKKNCDICKTLFGTHVNLICGDFLDDALFQGRDYISFDYIVGNPPFHDDYGVNKKCKRINGGKNKLYERIFLKSFSMLKNEGYISFVVPDNIFAGNGSQSYQILIQNTIPFVSFNPLNQSFFHKIQQPVCYFLLHKAKSSNLTKLEYNDQLTFQLKLQNRPVNPIRNWTPHTEKLINRFVSSERNTVRYNRGKNVQSYKGNKYSIVYTPVKSLQTNNPNLAVGFGQKKAILFSISPDLAFKMDYSGTLGSGPNTFYIPFNTISEGKKLEIFLNSQDYKILSLATKTTRQYLKIAFIEHLNLTHIFKTNKTIKRKIIHNKTRKHCK